MELQAANPHINRQREPAIGSLIVIPTQGAGDFGTLLRPDEGGLLQTAARHRMSPWSLAIRNELKSPFLPLFQRPLLAPASSGTPRDLPVGFSSFELSQLVGLPGQALAYRGRTAESVAISVTLNGNPFSAFENGHFRVGLVGTGAFFGAGEPELAVQVPGQPMWTQPWRFQDGDWSFQQITLTGAAASIDQESIARERARLFELWSVETPSPLWSAAFTSPVLDFLEISSHYGARRSYNGGPYSTYHEGVDFSAYGGTPVLAPAAGRVVLAEQLYVRGGAVILDHGLGVYTGYYHMSAVGVAVGDLVTPGQSLGEVGTTGLSTGNHLHWDLLVSGTWVDAAAWLEQGLACWILEGFGQQCDS
jgi:murein DD-endopeptidase MepM/ murein hydrolase activator NlpD